jgi:hypothetical protein
LDLVLTDVTWQDEFAFTGGDPTPDHQYYQSITTPSTFPGFLFDQRSHSFAVVPVAESGWGSYSTFPVTSK